MSDDRRINFRMLWNKDFVDAIRDVFPQEWRVVVTYEHKVRAETLLFGVYFIYDDTELRHDYEIVEEEVVTKNLNWEDIMLTIKSNIYTDIETGVVEGIKNGR